MTTESIPMEHIDFQGRYIIELKDERTGKVQEIVKSNYITPLWGNFAKMWQAFMPSFSNFMVHNSQVNQGNAAWVSVGQPFNQRTVYPFWQRPMPYQCIVLTDDTSAENTAHHWMKGTPIAWASMWKSANVPASGRRGQINDAECTVSSNGQVQKRVYDWLTTQGNGTYQTIGIGMIGSPNSGDVLLTNHGPYAIALPSQTELKAAVAAGPLGSSGGMNNLADITISNGKVFAKVITDNGGTNNWRTRTVVADVPGGLFSTDLDGSGMHYDLSGLTWTDIEAMTNWTGDGVTNSNYAGMYYAWRREIIYDSTDNDVAWAEIWGPSFPQGRIGRNDLTTKAAVWNRTWQTDYSRGNTTSTTYMGLAKIGSFLYIAVPEHGTSGGPSGEIWDRQVYRVNWSDGLGLTLVPLPTGFTLAGGMTTDGTDLFVWTNRGICRMTTAGAITANYGYPRDFIAGVAENSLSPWNPATSGGYQQLLKGNTQGPLFPFAPGYHLQSPGYSIQNDIYYPMFDGQGGYGDAGPSENSRHLRFVNGRLWLPAPSGITNAGVGLGASRALMIGITGANAFSRALLDAPVTKTSSQTMKVSYELTFPDMDAWVHDFPTV